MIDEELYQQAAEELNSDRRRPHIWARACALASDDHDEARYLYTNLRVEELIAQRDAGIITGSGSANPTDIEVEDPTLALEPISFNEADIDDAVTGFKNSDAASDLDLDSLDDLSPVPSSVSSPAGVDAPRDSDNLLSLGPDEDATQDVSDLVSETPVASEESFSFEEQEFARAASMREQEMDETVDLTSQFDGTAVFPPLTDNDKDQDLLLEAQEELPADGFVQSQADELRDSGKDASEDVLDKNNQQLDQLLADGIGDDEAIRDHDESVMTAEFSDATHSQTILDEDLDWLDQDVTADSTQKLSASESTFTDESAPSHTVQPYASSSDPVIPLRDSTDELAQELERQAEELPGHQGDVVAFDNGQQTIEEHFDDEVDADSSIDISSATSDSPTSAVAAATAGAAAASAGVAAAAMSSHDAGHSASEQNSTIRPEDLPDLPVDLSQYLPGTRYAVYRRGHNAQAVKTGVSWSALILTLPYLIYRHLFGTAIVYGILSVILLGGLLVSGLAWLDAGAAATTLTKATFAGFALLAVIGLLYLPFRHGNYWRGEKLEQRGYELVAWVRATSPGKALSEARRAAALD